MRSTGGFGGLLAAARLHESGVQDIRIIEKGGDFGGTWYWNRFPGAQCDIESYIYLPLLEETGYIPKEKYSFGDEIRAHARRIGEKFDLYRLACFQTEIGEIRWLQDENRWLITTNRGDAMHCRFVVISSGPLNRPKLPGIPGIKTFKQLPHQPLGLRLHWRHNRGWANKAYRQTSSDHWHGGNGHPVRPAPGPPC
jgi:cation diffusion facilitator CzcD-associated flavoprotein CzcO